MFIYSYILLKNLNQYNTQTLKKESMKNTINLLFFIALCLITSCVVAQHPQQLDAAQGQSGPVFIVGNSTGYSEYIIDTIYCNNEDLITKYERIITYGPGLQEYEVVTEGVCTDNVTIGMLEYFDSGYGKGDAGIAGGMSPGHDQSLYSIADYDYVLDSLDIVLVSSSGSSTSKTITLKVLGANPNTFTSAALSMPSNTQTGYTIDIPDFTISAGDTIVVNINGGSNFIGLLVKGTNDISNFGLFNHPANTFLSENDGGMRLIATVLPGIIDASIITLNGVVDTVYGPDLLSIPDFFSLVPETIPENIGNSNLSVPINTNRILTLDNGSFAINGSTFFRVDQGVGELFNLEANGGGMQYSTNGDVQIEYQGEGSWVGDDIYFSATGVAPIDFRIYGTPNSTSDANKNVALIDKTNGRITSIPMDSLATVFRGTHLSLVAMNAVTPVYAGDIAIFDTGTTSESYTYDGTAWVKTAGSYIQSPNSDVTITDTEFTMTLNNNLITSISSTGLMEHDGDIYLPNTVDGIILTSPDATCYRVTVADGGSLTTTSITCP